MKRTDRNEGRGGRTYSRVAAVILATTILAVGLSAPANAYTGKATGCPGSFHWMPYQVQPLNAGYSAYFSTRRIDRSPCYAGRQIVRVTYREFTGFPNALQWSLQETGPGQNAPQAWYINANQYLMVPSWEGGHYTKDIVTVDVRVEWFSDSWTPLGSIYLDHNTTSDYLCRWGGSCRIYSSTQVGAYVYYN